MLRSVRDLMECRIMTTNGSVGKVRDLFFDDRTGKITFLVAGKGSIGEEESVLIPLPAVTESDLENRKIMLQDALEGILSRRFSR